MPELPEVETMKASLLPYCNKIINNVSVFNFRLRELVNVSFIEDIKGTSINKIERYGKYLLFELTNNKYLLMHAGMSGKFIIEYKNDSLKTSITKHNHIIFYLQEDIKINFNDPRRFGLALTFNNKQDALKKINLGIDALSNELTTDYLAKHMNKSFTDIKTFLLNQKILAGIGNIYASEILYYSKIHPLTITKNLNEKQIIKIIQNTKIVLNKAIELGGSTLKDYKKPNGDFGYFQNNFAVYQRETQKCFSCNSIIKKINIKGRSTYFCPKEQLLT